MEVILKQDVEKLGFKDEIVSVKNGFGRNYLIPKGLAILATTSSIKVLEEKLRQQKNKEVSEIESANKLKEQIEKAEIVIKAKVAEGGTKLFGSIKTSQFVDALSKIGIEIDSKFVKLSSIKELGDYEADIRLHRIVSLSVPFKVVAE